MFWRMFIGSMTNRDFDTGRCLRVGAKTTGLNLLTVNNFAELQVYLFNSILLARRCLRDLQVVNAQSFQALSLDTSACRNLKATACQQKLTVLWYVKISSFTSKLFMMFNYEQSKSYSIVQDFKYLELL